MKVAISGCVLRCVIYGMHGRVNCVHLHVYEFC